MPSIKNSVARNQARYDMGGKPGEPPQQEPVSPSFTPQQDLPLGGGLPQRAMYPASFVLASDRSDSSREFRGAGARSAAFPFPSQPLIIKQS